jgi:NAD(P)-dependent dehydrogenase (short-subunit alcohol dehydrogenase family)
VTEKRILVTGASSGIGRACVLRLAAAGHRVIGVSRSGIATEARSCPGPLSGNIEYLRMDIADADTVQQTVEEAVSRMGRLDVVINSAGIAVAGSLEDTPLELVRLQMETNLLGAIYLTRAALPHLRRSAPSSLIHVSSLAGEVALPYQALYCATKFGLNGLCEALRYELEPQGIRVISIQPGSVRTALTKNRQTVAASEPYRASADAALAVNDSDEEAGVDPDVVARMVEETICDEKAIGWQTVGHFKERITVPARRLLPDRWFRRIIASHYTIASARFKPGAGKAPNDEVG